ncbi:ABC transporter substrate-binding protein [Halarcobacter sp.]|uniref:ABC transporter substrate-binding protein n=1 Tax=Halarcobacter sp. TaxID=2321133 RepID=UPI0029F54AB1|nr:ABC transporter substrate-binding protein [Halarcobacter sp.]
MKILFMIILIFISINAQEIKDIKVQFSWKNQFQFAGFIIAKEKGFYKDLGLNVKLLEFDPNRKQIDMIKGGEIDFAVNRSSILIDKSKGQNIVALGAIFQHSPLVLLIKDNKNIEKIEQLENKKVMITTDAKFSASIIAMLNANGIELSQIKILKHSFNIEDLINDKTDAMASYISNEPIVLEEKNIAYKVFDPKVYGFDFYDDIIYTTSLFIKNNPNITKKFYEATIRGWNYAFENIPQTAELIYEKYNTQNKSLNSLIKEGKILKNYAYDKHGNIGTLDKDRLVKINDVYRLMGLVKKQNNIEEFIYKENSVKNSINLVISDKNLYIYILISVFVIFIIVLLIIYFVIKKKWLITSYVFEKEMKQKTKQLKEEVYIDALTNIKNRKAFDEKLAVMLNDYKRYKNIFSIIYIDIDNFKTINDNYGHKIGDEVLCNFCRLVETKLRSNDYFYRVGGEEFIILLPNTNIENGIKVSEKLLESTKEKIKIENKICVTISIGLCEVKDEDDVCTLYKRVDSLLYKSKTEGKDRVSY